MSRTTKSMNDLLESSSEDSSVENDTAAGSDVDQDLSTESPLHKKIKTQKKNNSSDDSDEEYDLIIHGSDAGYRMDRDKIKTGTRHSGHAKGRINKGDKPDYFNNRRPQKIFDANKDEWDRVVLRVHQVPKRAHTSKVAANIFDDKSPRSRWDEVMGFDMNAADYYFSISPNKELRYEKSKADKIAQHKEILKNTIDLDKTTDKTEVLIERLNKLLKESESNEDGNDWRIKELITHINKSNKGNIWRNPEWLHTIADSLGGPVAYWNGASGTFAANTQMAVIENAIKGKPGIGVQVEAYVRPGTRVAEWYVYTVIARGKDGQPFSKLTFNIDARRDWYDVASYERDNAKIKHFLKETAKNRPDTNNNLFELPEIIDVRVSDKTSQKGYLKTGPVYAVQPSAYDVITTYSNSSSSAFSTKAEYAAYCLRAQHYKGKLTDLHGIKEFNSFPSESAYGYESDSSYAGDTDDENDGQVEKIKVNPNYLYQDNDINIYCTSIIQERLGGFKKVSDNKPIYRHYLLNRTFSEDSENYHVAYTPAVDTVGNAIIGSTPIDYYLDKINQPGNMLANLYRVLLKESNVLAQLQAIYNVKNDPKQLQAAISKKLEKYINDERTSELIALELIKYKFNQGIVDERIVELEARNPRIDVFDEIMPDLMKGGNGKAKIIFPYNQARNHWLTAEIIITRNGTDYTIDIYSHDPFGGGQMPKDKYDSICKAITKRLNEVHHPTLIVPKYTNQESEYNARQDKKDKHSCGAITADEIIKRIEGHSLELDKPYDVGAVDLRKAQAKYLPKQKKANTANDFDDSSNFDFDVNYQEDDHFKIAPDYLYEDNNINIYCSEIIQDRLGGFKLVGDEKSVACHYLLDGTFEDNDDDYQVAFTPAVDTVGSAFVSSTPIDYYLDKDNQPGNMLANLYKVLIKEKNTLAELRAIYNSKSDAKQLQAEIAKRLNKHINDDRTAELMALALIDYKFNQESVDKRIIELETRNPRIDVFDEIMPQLMKVGSSNAKIIFPYNQGRNHWLTAEIIIKRVGQNYTVDIYSYDPFGGGKMPDDKFASVRDAIEKRLKECHKPHEIQIKCNNQENNYSRRQNQQDKESCGVITADEIIKRIQGQSLENGKPYEVGANALRSQQAQIIITHALRAAIHNDDDDRVYDIIKNYGEFDYDIDTKDGNGNTLLHLAFMNRGKNYEDIIQGLINEGGADIDAQNDNGDTLLHLAVRAGDMDLVDILIKKQANLDIQNKSGKTPYDISKKGYIRDKLEVAAGIVSEGEYTDDNEDDADDELSDSDKDVTPSSVKPSSRSGYLNYSHKKKDWHAVTTRATEDVTMDNSDSAPKPTKEIRLKKKLGESEHVTATNNSTPPSTSHSFRTRS